MYLENKIENHVYILTTKDKALEEIYLAGYINTDANSRAKLLMAAASCLPELVEELIGLSAYDSKAHAMLKKLYRHPAMRFDKAAVEAHNNAPPPYTSQFPPDYDPAIADMAIAEARQRT